MEIESEANCLIEIIESEREKKHHFNWKRLNEWMWGTADYEIANKCTHKVNQTIQRCKYIFIHTMYLPSEQDSLIHSVDFMSCMFTANVKSCMHARGVQLTEFKVKQP